MIADDHPVVVDGVARALREAGITVVGTAATGGEALAMLVRTTPDVAVLDVRMPGLSGLEIAIQVATSSPKTAVVLYTGYSEQALLLEAIDSGVRGFVVKDAALSEVVHAIRIVASGGSYVDPKLAGAIAMGSIARHLETVSPREREILRLIADGFHNEEIASRLFISASTVRTHVRRAMTKLNADTRSQAVAEAFRHQLIE